MPEGDSSHREPHLQGAAHWTENHERASQQTSPGEPQQGALQTEGRDTRGDMGHQHGGRAAGTGTTEAIPVLLSPLNVFGGRAKMVSVRAGRRHTVLARGHGNLWGGLLCGGHGSAGPEQPLKTLRK